MDQISGPLQALVAIIMAVITLLLLLVPNSKSRSAEGTQNHTNQAKSDNKNRNSIAIGGIAVLVGLMVYFGLFPRSLQAGSTPQTDPRMVGVPASEVEKDAIRGAIRAANQSEEEAYKSLPTINLDELKKHFVESSPAYTKIVGILYRSKQYNRTASNPGNPTTHEITGFDPIITVSEDTAHARTNEHWLVQWYDKTRRLYTKPYETEPTHAHEYTLRRIDGRWKVAVDQY